MSVIGFYANYYLVALRGWLLAITAHQDVTVFTDKARSDQQKFRINGRTAGLAVTRFQLLRTKAKLMCFSMSRSR